jgi:hypothetical protein
MLDNPVIRSGDTREAPGAIPPRRVIWASGSPLFPLSPGAVREFRACAPEAPEGQAPANSH